MADDSNHDKQNSTLGHSSFRSAREAGGNSLHGADDEEQQRPDDSMNPETPDAPTGAVTAIGGTAGAVAGAVVGAVAGAVAGPVGIVAGAAAGAAIGGAAGSSAGHSAETTTDEKPADESEENRSPQDVIGASPKSSLKSGPR